MNKNKILKNSLITLAVFILAFIACAILQNVLVIKEHVTTVFVFAVFVVSLLTDGYVYGFISTAIGFLAVNYAFTFPYFAFNFTVIENVLSALVMIVISLLTSALTTRVKRWEQIKKEGELEIMRANLLRAVSHDIRTPLTTIYGSSSTILENYASLSDEQKLKMVNGIKEDAEWLNRMVENLLSVTKLENSHLGIIKTPTALDELIDSVYIKFQKRYPNQKVEISIPDELVIIPIDAILVEQVLINLLENAVLHAENMTRLSLSVTTSNDKIVFEVADDGKGIDKEILGNIFSGNISMKADKMDSKKRNAGIGLSLCASIIKAHGGEIFAQNKKEGGALFSFILSL